MADTNGTGAEPGPDVEPDGDVDRLTRRLARTRAALKEAEQLLEERSRELWAANEALVEAVRQLDDQAKHDELTGLPNRRSIQEWIAPRVRPTLRTGMRIGLLSIDLDHFKDVNDAHGHAVGDAYLQEVARRFTAAVRTDDLVVRLGGDEILILLHGVRDLDDAVAVATKVRAAIDMPLMAGGRTLHPTASIGVTLLHDGENLEAAQRRADFALYGAKSAGRNRIMVAG